MHRRKNYTNIKRNNRQKINDAENGKNIFLLVSDSEYPEKIFYSKQYSDGKFRNIKKQMIFFFQQRNGFDHYQNGTHQDKYQKRDVKSFS
jgi:hypothetical protein